MISALRWSTDTTPTRGHDLRRTSPTRSATASAESPPATLTGAGPPGQLESTAASAPVDAT